MSDGIKVLHLSRSAVAGAPHFWSEAMRLYGAPLIEWSRCYSQSSAYKDGRSFPSDLTPAEAKSLLRTADVIIVHNQAPTCLGDLPMGKVVLAVHSRPNQVDEWMLHNRPVGVIAQHHPGFYRGKVDFVLLPNLIDLWFYDRHVPLKRDGAVLIGYSPSFLGDVPKGELTWDSNKGYSAVSRVIGRINDEKRGCGVVYVGKPWAALTKVMGAADVWIDECVTGSYHRCSLQAAALAQVPINAASDDSLANLNIVAGSADHPFLRVKQDDLYTTLCRLCAKPEETRERGRLAQEWMRAHWDPRRQIKDCFIPLLMKVR